MNDVIKGFTYARLVRFHDHFLIYICHAFDIPIVPQGPALLSFRLRLDINLITLIIQCMVKDGVLEAQFVKTTGLAVCLKLHCIGYLSRFTLRAAKLLKDVGSSQSSISVQLPSGQHSTIQRRGMQRLRRGRCSAEAIKRRSLRQSVFPSGKVTYLVETVPTIMPGVLLFFFVYLGGSDRRVSGLLSLVESVSIPMPGQILRVF